MLTVALKHVVQTVNLDVIDLFQRIFIINPKKRMTINQLYEHPLIRDRVIKEKELFLEKIPVYEEN